MSNLNPYTIIWTILIPTKGIARKSDEKQTDFNRMMSNSCLIAHSPNKEKALQRVNSLKGKLAKKYEVLFITDKQFGLIQLDYINNTHNIMDIATSKQIKEIFKI